MYHELLLQTKDSGEQKNIYLYFWHLFSRCPSGFPFFILHIILLWIRYSFDHLPEGAHT